MNARFGSMGAAVVAVAVFAGTARAQLVTQPHVGYQAAGNGKPAMAEPGSVVSLPADGNFYRVYCDYGPIVDGTFKPDPAVNKGGPSRIVVNATAAKPMSVRFLGVCKHVLPITLTPQDGNAAWGVGRPHALTNPPAGLYVRARLQVLDGFLWADVPNTATYAPVPEK